ncbi:MAG: hypothetical protein J5803_05080, partial [Desulfovibrio sp.]|nr:hypothetical protein [Desulfovibrio sp.]
ARESGLKAEKSDLLSADELVSKMAFSNQDAMLILSGTPIDTLLQAGNEALVVRVDSIQNESKLPFENVEETIKSKLSAQKAQEAALKKAEELRATLHDGPMADSLRSSLSIKTSEEADRSQAIAPFVMNESLSQACFQAKKDAWLANAYAVTMKDGKEGAAIFHVNAIKPANTEDWERIHTILENGFARDTADNIRSFFMNELFKKAQIKNVQIEKADRLDG